MVARPAPSLRARALRFLARREHSRAELQRKLAALNDEGVDLDALLDELAARGWLSDARFAQQCVRTKSRRFGPARLVQRLRASGIDNETIALALREGGDPQVNLEAVWKSRFRDAPRDDRERGRQVRFLQGRGFALEEILRFLKGLPRA